MKENILSWYVISCKIKCKVQWWETQTSQLSVFINTQGVRGEANPNLLISSKKHQRFCVYDKVCPKVAHPQPQNRLKGQTQRMERVTYLLYNQSNQNGTTYIEIRNSPKLTAPEIMSIHTRNQMGSQILKYRGSDPFMKHIRFVELSSVIGKHL